MRALQTGRIRSVQVIGPNAFGLIIFLRARMTDHRINLTLYKLDQVMQGDLDDIVAALTAADQAAKLAAMET